MALSISTYAYRFSIEFQINGLDTNYSGKKRNLRVYNSSGTNIYNDTIPNGQSTYTFTVCNLDFYQSSHSFTVEIDWYNGQTYGGTSELLVNNIKLNTSGNITNFEVNNYYIFYNCFYIPSGELEFSILQFLTPTEAEYFYKHETKFQVAFQCNNTNKTINCQLIDTDERILTSLKDLKFTDLSKNKQYKIEIISVSLGSHTVKDLSPPYSNITTLSSLPIIEVDVYNWNSLQLSLVDQNSEYDNFDNFDIEWYDYDDEYLGSGTTINVTDLSENTDYTFYCLLYHTEVNYEFYTADFEFTTFYKPKLSLKSATTNSLTVELKNYSQYFNDYAVTVKWKIGTSSTISTSELTTYTFSNLSKNVKYNITVIFKYENKDRVTITDSFSTTNNTIQLFNWEDYSYYDEDEEKDIPQPEPKPGQKFVLSAEAWNGLIDKIDEILDLKENSESDLQRVSSGNPITAIIYNELGAAIVELSWNYDKIHGADYYESFMNYGKAKKYEPITASKINTLALVLNDTIEYINENG